VTSSSRDVKTSEESEERKEGEVLDSGEDEKIRKVDSSRAKRRRSGPIY